MIAQLSGRVAHKEGGVLVVMVDGVGYKVHVHDPVGKDAELEEDISLWTHLAVRENAMELYGFRERKELELFELLVGVSGIGPKSALAIMNLASADELSRAVASGDTSYLTKVSGIGRKTAAKIVFELKDAMGKRGDGDDGRILKEESEALEALLALGYSARDARGALARIEDKTLSTNEKIKEALKLLSR